MFLKQKNKKCYTIEKSFKKVSGLYAAILMGELVVSFFDVTNRLLEYFALPYDFACVLLSELPK